MRIPSFPMSTLLFLRQGLKWPHRLTSYGFGNPFGNKVLILGYRTEHHWHNWVHMHNYGLIRLLLCILYDKEDYWGSWVGKNQVVLWEEQSDRHVKSEPKAMVDKEGGIWNSTGTWRWGPLTCQLMKRNRKQSRNPKMKKHEHCNS